MPDFFIVGAPKCGTTSLATWLGEHQHVFMSPIKEPNFFCFDAPRRRKYASTEAYGRLFESARPWQTCGEASTSYLFSDVAIPAILEANPLASIMAIVRNPLEMVGSYHAQKLYDLEEDEPDLARAWRLSSERANGRVIPQHCLAPRYLDYRGMGLLGWQVQRLMNWVPRHQLHVMVFDDLKSDPGSVYRDALLFLGALADGRSDFSVKKPRKAHIMPRLARLRKYPVGPARWVKEIAKRAFPAQTRALGDKLSRLNARPIERRPLSEPLRREMLAAFKDDIALLGRLLNRDLSHWYR